MFSRFSRRGLCFLLALVTLCMCLSPALVQPAEAVAGIDDATIAVGLLFASWAGVTFMTNQGAYTAVSNFLSSSAAGLKACSDVAANYLVNGSLRLVQDVKDAFSSFLPDFNSTFQTPAGSLDGSLIGSFPLGVDFPFDSSSPLSIPSSFFGGSTSNVVNFSLSNGSVYILSEEINGYSVLLPNGNRSYEPKHFYSGYSVSSITPTVHDGYSALEFFFIRDDGKPGTKVDYLHLSSTDFASISFSGIEGLVPWKVRAQRKLLQQEVKDLAFAPNNSLAPTDPPSPDEPTRDPDQNVINGLSLAMLLAIIKNLQGSEASLLSPEEMIEELKKILGKSQPDPNPDPTTDPSEATEPSEVPEPSEDPSSPIKPPTTYDDPPAFDDLLLPGLRDFFPFCIPFDLYAMMQALCAEPVAPVFTFATSFLGQVYTVDIDLSAWESVAVMVRYMFIAIYIVSLAVATRKFIKW